MATGFVRGKLKRAVEAADLSMRLTRDLRSCAALLSCYAGIARNPNDHSEVSFTVRLPRARFPITIRKSDIFTVSEIFFDREYALCTALPQNPVIFDCGANVGLSAIWFLGCGPALACTPLNRSRRTFACSA
jgi:hypothetical protein